MGIKNLNFELILQKNWKTITIIIFHLAVQKQKENLFLDFPNILFSSVHFKCISTKIYINGQRDKT